MQQSSTASRAESDERTCKIDRIAVEYDLGDIAEELGELWTREEERYSLRRLATHFNRRLLRAAMERNGMDVLEGEAENTYRLLTDDDVSVGTRTQARNRLRKQGVDIEAVESAFVSYQTVNRHLKGCLDAERPAEPDEDGVEKATQRIAALRNRTVVVTENTLSQLRSADEITLGDADVFVDITVTCADCGTHTTARELIADGGCDCE
ncbi:rod-determining factor RdfA [Halococcus hamelinensis]|jgi:hypothetical protein|uniref:Uncharacterized protein n=1 Tax=Halococcus hamelinensis 100A6 TaxID=1132509 RepID=M0M9Y1_9EURY|nr:rod-determining factor RdfA [Halococcus hamelinensis]EMA41215.1 hypothetical protein C447_02182 [Halococcus hamelinensis 100A6]